MQQLPDDRREALIMRFALGMDNREIARALGRTDGATKVLLHRAIRQLEELVKKAEAGRRERVSQPFDFEALLRAALAPIEPPEELAARLESRLGSLVELAADELEAWELSAMRDPRNWPRAAIRPAAAVVVGVGAGAGLVVLRTQRRRHKRRAAVAQRARPRRAHAARRRARGAARLRGRGAETLIRLIRSAAGAK